MQESIFCQAPPKYDTNKEFRNCYGNNGNLENLLWIKSIILYTITLKSLEYRKHIFCDHIHFEMQESIFCKAPRKYDTNKEFCDCYGICGI